MSTRTSTLDPTIEDAEETKRPPSKEAVVSHLVALDPEDNPQCMPILRRWVTVLVISSASLCVTCASSVAAFTEAGSAQTFHVSHEVTILAISLYVCGLGAGPLLVGPLSEVYGRNIIYQVSYILFFIFTFPVAFAPNIGVFLFFRLITGFCGAAFLSVAGGSVSDMFPDSTVAKVSHEIALSGEIRSPFIGPVAGPLIAGTYTGDGRTGLCCAGSLPKPVLLFLVKHGDTIRHSLRSLTRLRKVTGDASYYAPLDKVQSSLAQSITVSCYRPFQLLLFDRMALLLNIWTALLLGILYLAFQAFPVIFEGSHHFNEQMTGLTFLGIGVGMFAGISTQPLWNMLFTREAIRYDGNPPPEVRLIMGQVGAILVPIGLFWLAFTTYPQVHWIAPIIASVPFGSGIYFVFTSTFTYLVTAYRPIAASAMASNSALRSAFAAAFPLFAGAMYDRLGTVGATALLAGLTTIMAPLPFIFYRIGGRLRMSSKFATH
ncbi:major facilitator superfamily domain-containing protein [Boletus coccyginus]|nr:major facilitator superfamily domain-containing protein [Boletus coccyginus]